MTASTETLMRRQVPLRGMPDFFIVGHAKSGTTALYEALRAYPRIYMPDLKETRFFARELHPRLGESTSHPQTLEDYLSLFAPAQPGQRVGEASPSYLRSATAAARIGELRPDARIIAIFREPASFLRSLHLQLLQAHVETEKALRRALALEARRRREKDAGGLVEQGLMYSEHIRYVEQLQRFHAVFGSEQVLTLIYEDFRADNVGTARRVLQFLGVDESAPIEFKDANPSVLVRSPGLYDMLRSLYMGQGPAAAPVKAAINAVTPRRLRHAALTGARRAQWSQPGPVDEELMGELRHRFREQVISFGRYIGRDLTAVWGYDRLG